ncbi:hypothetical protein OIV83_005553 [Microbotryomycetes sp. JL201]|nr:hypothetical protein OIV83_005553 [Microbotryomycetes sp. JL201]
MPEIGDETDREAAFQVQAWLKAFGLRQLFGSRKELCPRFWQKLGYEALPLRSESQSKQFKSVINGFFARYESPPNDARAKSSQEAFWKLDAVLEGSTLRSSLKDHLLDNKVYSARYMESIFKVKDNQLTTLSSFINIIVRAAFSNGASLSNEQQALRHAC